MTRKEIPSIGIIFGKTDVLKTQSKRGSSDDKMTRKNPSSSTVAKSNTEPLCHHYCSGVL